MKRKIYGAYGSNINLRQMELRCPKAIPLTIGMLNGYELTFRRGGYANIEPKEGASVPILLWEITDGCEHSLDHYEGYPSFYTKETVKVETDSGVFETMIYVMTDEMMGDYELPRADYYYGIVDGYKANRMPIEYLETAFEKCKKTVIGKMPKRGMKDVY